MLVVSNYWRLSNVENITEEIYGKEMQSYVKTLFTKLSVDNF